MQNIENIPYSNLPFYSKLLKDYASGKPELRQFYEYEPSLEGVLEAAKQRIFSKESRSFLVNSLREQYRGMKISQAIQENLEKLFLENTFTITTGHQLGAYTGPAYFIYKIASVINLAKQLNETDPSRNFVPVFWMASEDHDFDEISEVHFTGRNWKWEAEDETFGKVPVGDLNPATLSGWADEMKEYFHQELPVSEILSIYKHAYSDNKTLSGATRQIVNELFGENGLIIIDGNNKMLKSMFTKVMLKEIEDDSSHSLVQETTISLEALSYSGQIVSRAVNMFYFDDLNYRQKIEKNANEFKIHGSSTSLSLNELASLIKKEPQKFSPNVVLRPVYQETILPNIAYIGGPAEVAYWLQLRNVFNHFNTQFPVVGVRSSFLILNESLSQKIDAGKFSIIDYLVNSTDELVNKFIQSTFSADVNFDAEMQLVNRIIDQTLKKLENPDKQLLTQVSIEEKNMKESIQRLQLKITKFLKQQSDNDLKNIHKIKTSIFPEKALQERFLNLFSLISFKSINLNKIIEQSSPFKWSIQVVQD